MKNTKKFISTSLFVLLVLTLVSFCFVGFTFARYTSTGTGAATVNVAKWEIKDVANVAEGKTTVDFGKLSPLNAEKPANATTNPRKNSTNATLVVTITNNSDVDADITITHGDVTLKQLATPVEGAATYNEGNAKMVFTIELYKDAAQTEKIDTTAVRLANGESLTVYAVVTWTSDVEGITDADANDTMIGQNVESVSYEITWTAVQASKIPA